MAINPVFNATADVTFQDAVKGPVCVPRMNYKIPTWEIWASGRYIVYQDSTIPPIPFTTTLGNVFHLNDQFLSTRSFCFESATGGTPTALVSVTSTTITSTVYKNVPTPTATETTADWCNYCGMYLPDFQVYSWYPSIVTNTVATAVVTIRKGNSTSSQTAAPAILTPTTSFTLPSDMVLPSQKVVDSTVYELAPGTTLTWPSTYISIGPSIFIDRAWTEGEIPNLVCYQTAETSTMTGTATEISPYNNRAKGLVWGFTTTYNSWLDIPGKPLHQFATNLPDSCGEMAVGPPPFYLVPVSSITTTQYVIEGDDGHFTTSTSKDHAVTLTTAPPLGITPHPADPAEPVQTASPIITKTPSPASPPITPPQTTINNIPVTPTSNVVIIGSSTLSQGSAITISNTRISLAPSGTAIIIGSSTIPFTFPAAVNAPVPTPPVLTVGGQKVTAGSDTAFVISGQTLRPGGQITIDGKVISLAADGSVAVIDGSVQPLIAGPAPIPFYNVPVPGSVRTLTINGVTASIGMDSAGNFVYNGMIMPAGAAFVLGGTIVNLGRDGQLIVGGTTLVANGAQVLVSGTVAVSLAGAQMSGAGNSVEALGLNTKVEANVEPAMSSEISALANVEAPTGSSPDAPKSSSSSALAWKIYPHVGELGWFVSAFVTLLGFL